MRTARAAVSSSSQTQGAILLVSRLGCCLILLGVLLRRNSRHPAISSHALGNVAKYAASSVLNAQKRYREAKAEAIRIVLRLGISLKSCLDLYAFRLLVLRKNTNGYTR